MPTGASPLIELTVSGLLLGLKEGEKAKGIPKLGILETEILVESEKGRTFASGHLGNEGKLGPKFGGFWQ